MPELLNAKSSESDLVENPIYYEDEVQNYDYGEEIQIKIEGVSTGKGRVYRDRLPKKKVDSDKENNYENSSE